MSKVKKLVRGDSDDCSSFLLLLSDSSSSSGVSDDVEPEMSIVSRGRKPNATPECESCKCPYLKYTKEQMDRNPVQFDDQYGSVLLITLQDVDNVRRKWRKIKNDLTTFGTLIMITLLNDDPDTAEKYNASPGVLTNGLMVYDEGTIQVGKRIANMICYMVKHLDEPVILSDFAYREGRAIPLRISGGLKLTEEDFKAVKSAVLKTVTTYYKMDNTPEIIQSIEKICRIIFNIIEDATHSNDFGKR